MTGRRTSTIPRLIAALAAGLLWCVATTVHSDQAQAVRDGGAVSGFVRYRGTPPSPVLLAITKDREVCGTSPHHDQSLIVGPDHGVANAVVTLTDKAQAARLKPEPAVQFDQKGCQYIPHVAVFPAGSTVVILNSDGILHNIHTESSADPVIDLAQPGFKKQIRVTLEKPDTIKVTCDAHNWMEGWWYVTDTPYYAITDQHGHYIIRNVPPGAYTMRIWQERVGAQTRRIVVKPGGANPADFTISLSKGKSPQ